MKLKTAIVCLEQDKFVKYHNIGCEYRFKSFLEQKFQKWKFITWYDKKTREKLFVESFSFDLSKN